MRVHAVIVGVALAFLAAGCGAVAHMTADEGKQAPGKALFVAKCGACHTMSDAKTTGTDSPIGGPSLDDVFGTVRDQGFDESTIRDVVRGQIAYPETERLAEEPDPDGSWEEKPGMPANLVTGQDADDVAEYVAACAGTDPSHTPNCDVNG
jgi:mono/diheme cytochrome c family protein